MPVVALFAAAALFEVPVAEAQTRPISSDDSLYTSIDADRWTVCGVSKAGYIRCRGSIWMAPLRSETVGYVQAANSNRFTCGRKADGSVKCWAGRSYNLPTLPRFDPDGTPNNGDERPYTFSDIQAAQGHGCGLTDGGNGQTAGKLLCWGAGTVSPGSPAEKLSTIPNGSSTLNLIPAASGGNVNFTALAFSHLASGGHSNCALISSSDLNNGKPRCWSSIASAGNAGVSEPDIPLSAITIGALDPACGLVKENATVGGKTYVIGQIVCWGLNFSNIVSGAPTTGTYTALAIGTHHACAVNTAGKITCWGKGTSDSNTTDQNYGQMTVPGALANATFSTVHAGRDFTCGLLDGRGGQVASTLHCWGEQNYATVLPNNDPSSFPRGSTVAYEARPRIPPLATSLDAMDVNDTSSCALTTTGDAACWGNSDYGWPPPQQVTGVAAGFGGYCFLDKGGKAFCMGANWYGMASGTSTSSTAMTADLNARRFSRIYAGLQHYCGIIDDGDASGKVRCWGYNDQGQSEAPGQTAVTNPSPSQSKTITDLGTNTYTKITAGYRYTCGLLTTGSIAC